MGSTRGLNLTAASDIIFEFVTLADDDAAAKPFELFKDILDDADAEKEHEN